MSDASKEVYEFLINEEDARACKDLSEEACQVVPGNFLIILLAQFLTKIADALSSSRIVLPWLLSSIGAPNFIAGLLVPIRESGSLIPQLLIGGFVRRHPVRKWFFVFGCAAQASCVGVMAWVATSLEGIGAAACILLLLILFSLARGVCSVASKDVLGKTIPKRRRGTLNGYGASLAGIVTIGVGGFLIAGTEPGSELISGLLLIACACWMLAAFAFANIREYRGSTEGGSNALANAVASLGILRSDTTFLRFVITRCLLMASGLSAPYFVLLAQQSSTSDSNLGLGLFLGVSGLASLVSGYFWGRFADKNSRGVMLITSACTALLCGVAAWLSMTGAGAETVVLVILFFLLSIVHQGVRLGRKTYIVDLAGGNKRTEYVTVSNSVIGILLLVVGLAGAATASISLSAAFIFFAISSLCAFVTGWSLPPID